jgi:protein TonB
VSSRTLLYSLLVHAAAAGALLFAAERKQAHHATAVAVVGEKKKEKPREEKKPPKPIVTHEEKRPAHSAPPQKASAPPPPSSAPAPAARSGPPPVETGLTLGDADGPGMDVGGPAKPAAAPSKVLTPAPATPKKHAQETKRDDAPAEEECHEEPTKPEPLARPEIEYTQAARAAGVEGRLVLKLTVAADGTVAKADVVSSVDPGLDASALATVQTWRFKPATRCGKPMFGGVYTLARRFELGD